MTTERFTIVYNEQLKMMQYVDNYKKEPNKWAIWNASETAQKLNKLNDENEQLKENIADWETSFDLLKHENEQLKQQETRLYKYFRKCFDNVSEQGFRETWEVVKKYD